MNRFYNKKKMVKEDQNILRAPNVKYWSLREQRRGMPHNFLRAAAGIPTKV